MTSQRVLRNAPGKQPPDCARPRICGRSCLSLWKPWAFSPTPRAGVWGLGEAPGSAGRSGRAELTGRPVLGFLEPVGSVRGAFWSRSRLQPRPPRTASGAVRCGSALPTHPGSLSGAHPAAPRVLAQDWGAPGVQIAGRDVSPHRPRPHKHTLWDVGEFEEENRKWGRASLSSPRGAFSRLPVLSPSFRFLNWRSWKQFWELDLSEQKRFASQKQSRRALRRDPG